MTLILQNGKVTIDSWSKIGNPLTARGIVSSEQQVSNTSRASYPNTQGNLVNRYTVPSGKQFQIINIGYFAQAGQLLVMQQTNGFSQVLANIGIGNLQIAGSNTIEIRPQPTDLFWLDPQGNFSAGGNRNRGQDPSRSVLTFPDVQLANGESAELLWTPTSASGPTGTEIQGHRVSGAIYHSGGIAQGAIVPYDTTENVVVASVTAGVGGLTLQGAMLWAEFCSAPVLVTVVIDGRLVWEGPVASSGKFKQKNLRCGCTDLILYPGQSVECWANTMMPGNQTVGCQIVGDLVDFGSDLFTDPGIANVRSGTAYQFNSPTNNKTGTLSVGGGGGGYSKGRMVNA